MRWAIFIVSLSKPAPVPVSINYAAQPLTAQSPADFTAVSGSVNFAQGESVRQIMVPVRDDFDGAPEEAFRVVLSAPVNATIGDNEGICVIPESEPATQPVVSVNNPTVPSL